MSAFAFLQPLRAFRNQASARNPASSTAYADICDQIYSLVCHKKGETRDPTGSVQPDVEGEIQALQIQERLTSENPSWTRDQIEEALVREIYTPRRKVSMETAFRWVMGELTRYIQRQSEFTSEEKKTLISRIRKTRLELPPPAGVYKDEKHLFTANEVFYERTTPGNMKLRVGGAYLLATKSWFNLVFTMAHELAHSIDPCEVRSDHLAFPAYDRLIACFLKTGLIATRTTRSECGRHDQLSEVFADSIAAEITADSLAQYATEFDSKQILDAARNSVRDLCDQEDETTEPDSEFHPPPAVRIGVFGNNPRIRSLLGCRGLEPPATHCTFDWREKS